MDKSLLEQAREELTDARRVLANSGGGHPNAFTRAAQIAVVAQAEAADRQADALERIADHLAGPPPAAADRPLAGPPPWLSIFPPAADGTVLITNTLTGQSRVANLGDDDYVEAAFPGWTMQITWQQDR